VPQVVRCPNCQAPLTVDPGRPVLRCEYCGADVKQTVAMQPVQRPTPPPASGPSAEQLAQGRRVMKLVLWITIGSTVLPVIIIGAVCAIGMHTAGSTISSSVKSARSVGDDIASSIRAAESAARRAARTAGASARSAGAEPEAAPDPEAALAAKLAAYLVCINEESRAVHESRGRYLGWVRDAVKGPTCKESCVTWGIFKLTPATGARSCTEGVARLKTAAPRNAELEAAGDALVASLQELAPLVGEAERYYSQKDYEDDSCAKGQALHGKLLPAFARFDKADGALRAVLARELYPLQARQLARLEQSAPAGLGHALLKLGVSARKLVEAGQAARGKAEVPALREAIAEYASALKLMERGCRHAGSRDPSVIASCAFGERGSRELLMAAKARARALSRPRPPALRGSDEGSVERLLDRHRQILRWIPAGLEQRPATYQRCG